MFNHVIMEMSLEDICARNVGGKRVYEVGDQRYPSISTICSLEIENLLLNGEHELVLKKQTRFLNVLLLQVLQFIV